MQEQNPKLLDCKFLVCDKKILKFVAQLGKEHMAARSLVPQGDNIKSTEKKIRSIRRQTRKKYSAEQEQELHQIVHSLVHKTA
jgi:hypothetical protein